MKKLLFLITAIVLCVAIFAACGQEAPATDAAGEDAAAIASETFDAGNITVEVPEGWAAFPVVDAFSEDASNDPNAVMIIKGGDDELDAFTHPYMQINYYDPAETEMMLPDPTWYDDPADIDDMELGGRTWKGFTAVSLDYPIAALWTIDDAGDQFQGLVWTDMDNGSITLGDADVQAILASVTVK